MKADRNGFGGPPTIRDDRNDKGFPVSVVPSLAVKYRVTQSLYAESVSHQSPGSRTKWAHPGGPTKECTTLKGLNNRQFAGKPRAFVLWNPGRVRAAAVLRFPGWRGCAADPGLRWETPSAYSRYGKSLSLC